MMLADIDYAEIRRPPSALPFLVSSRRPQLLDRKEKAVCIAIDSRDPWQVSSYASTIRFPTGGRERVPV
jgi:hypothetical protein